MGLAVVISFVACGGNSSGDKAQLVSEFSADFEIYKKQRLECDKVQVTWGGGYHKELVEPIIAKIEKEQEEWRDKLEAAQISNDGEKFVKLRK